MMGLPTDEQETCISFSRNSNTCAVYTTDSTVITKNKWESCHEFTFVMMRACWNAASSMAAGS